MTIKTDKEALTSEEQKLRDEIALAIRDAMWRGEFNADDIADRVVKALRTQSSTLEQGGGDE